MPKVAKFPKSIISQYYGDYYQDLLSALETLDLFISDLEVDMIRERGRNPIEYVKRRIKTPESMKEKIERLRRAGENIQGPEDLFDGVGMRLVCTFIDDVYAVRSWFVKRPELMIITEKDYVRRPKASGYRSFHLQVRVHIDTDKWINAEIQIRTIAMDCWATLEHQLRYKKHLLNADMMAFELKRCADEMASTDLNLMTIRDRIVYDSDEGGQE